MGHELVADWDGEFWGIAGHHSARTLLRVIKSETGMDISEVTGAYASDHPWQDWCNGVTQGWWRVVSRDDPATWSDVEREAVENGHWPHEWDDVFLVCDEGTEGAMAATFWRA